MQIEPNDLLMILLNGNLADSVAVPKAIADPLRGHPEIVIEDDCPAASFVTVWSPFGWENEVRRRLYIEQLKPLPKATPAKKPAIDISQYV